MAEMRRRVDDLHAALRFRRGGDRAVGDRQDRRADRIGTVAHQVVPVVAERHDPQRTATRRRPGRRPPRPGPGRARPARRRRTRRPPAITTGASMTRQRGRSGRTRTSSWTLRLEGVRPRRPGRPCRRASRRPSPAPRAPGRRPTSADRTPRGRRGTRVIERMTSGGSSRPRRNSSTSRPRRGLERLPAAVDEDEPGTPLAQRDRGPGRDDRPEPVTGEDDPIVRRRRAAPSPRPPRRRHRRRTSRS